MSSEITVEFQLASEAEMAPLKERMRRVIAGARTTTTDDTRTFIDMLDLWPAEQRAAAGRTTRSA